MDEGIIDGRFDKETRTRWWDIDKNNPYLTSYKNEFSIPDVYKWFNTNMVEAVYKRSKVFDIPFVTLGPTSAERNHFNYLKSIDDPI